MQDMYTENYRMLLREIQEDPNKWNNMPCAWVERRNIIKSNLPKLIYRCNSVLIKISADFQFLIEIDELILKFIWT